MDSNYNIYVDLGLYFLSIACFLFGVPAFFMARKMSGKDSSREMGKLMAVLIPAFCLMVWGWTFKVHGLDENLNIAAREGSLEEVKRLMSWGADPNDPFDSGSALDVAEEALSYDSENHPAERRRVYEYLKSHGARHMRR